MSDTKLKVARIISVVAATLISLACGTNVSHHIAVNFKQLNLETVCILSMGPAICGKNEALGNRKQPNCGFKFNRTEEPAKPAQGTLANVGMYASGIPVGLFVDAKGPRPGVMFGALTLGLGYFVLYRGTSC